MENTHHKYKYGFELYQTVNHIGMLYGWVKILIYDIFSLKLLGIVKYRAPFRGKQGRPGAWVLSPIYDNVCVGLNYIALG